MGGFPKDVDGRKESSPGPWKILTFDEIAEWPRQWQVSPNRSLTKGKNDEPDAIRDAATALREGQWDEYTSLIRPLQRDDEEVDAGCSCSVLPTLVNLVSVLATLSKSKPSSLPSAPSGHWQAASALVRRGDCSLGLRHGNRRVI